MPDDHEHLFVEEQEPEGRLILPPCILCGLTAMDALEQLADERGTPPADAEARRRSGRKAPPHRSPP